MGSVPHNFVHAIVMDVQLLQLSALLNGENGLRRTAFGAQRVFSMNELTRDDNVERRKHYCR